MPKQRQKQKGAVTQSCQDPCDDDFDAHDFLLSMPEEPTKQPKPDEFEDFDAREYLLNG